MLPCIIESLWNVYGLYQFYHENIMKNIRDLKIAIISIMFNLTGQLYFTKNWWNYALEFIPILLLRVALSSKRNEASGEEMKYAYIMMIIAINWVAKALQLEESWLILMVGFLLLGIMATECSTSIMS